MNGMKNEFNLFEGITEERVRSLEQRVDLQEDEITLLKSSLSDALRRLKELEVSPYTSPRRPSPLKNHFQPLPSKPTLDHGGQPKLRTRPPSPSVKGRVTPIRDIESRGHNGRADVRKSSSFDSFSRNGKRSNSRTRKPSGASKAPTYNDDDCSVRMHLRGRPVVLYKPSALEYYNPSDQSQLPDHKLKLEWVYGYRGKDCRSNLYYLPTGEVVYFIAAVVVLYDPKDGYQRHYLGHNDDVKCLAIHPSKLKIASGQMSGLEMDGRPRCPQVHVWDAVTLNTLHVIDSFDRSVASVSFSKIDGGALLCAVDESNDHVMTVWDWAKETKLAEAKSSKDQVLACEFNPYVEGMIVTCGKSHINFWSLESGQLTRKQGLFEVQLESYHSYRYTLVIYNSVDEFFLSKHEKPKYLLCLGFTSSGEVLSGDSNGNIQVWSKGPTRKITRIIEKAHEGPVFTIFAARDFFITGGKDGKLRKWSEDFASTNQTEIPSDAGSVRTVTCNDQGTMLVGTKSNRILYGGFDKQFDTIVHGHTEELWGLAVHPTQPHFVTGSQDKQLIMWNGYNHSPMWIKTFDDGVQSADFHPVVENLIAVGMTTGRWVVLDSVNQELVTVHTDGPEQHDVIKFSPDGSCLAIGSHDNNIYVYSVGENGRKYSRVGRCSGHSSYITHLDWSKDSQYLQSNSGDYELLYWEVSSCKQVPTPSSFRDVEWQTQSCTLGFSVLGIWPEGADGTDLNSVGRSNNGKLLASGDDFGKVHLYKYPAIQPRSVNHEYRGHSSHVTSVKFLSNNEKLLSTGGQDCSTMQWKVV